jgi:hypothetical protein
MGEQEQEEEDQEQEKQVSGYFDPETRSIVIVEDEEE